MTDLPLSSGELAMARHRAARIHALEQRLAALLPRLAAIRAQSSNDKFHDRLNILKHPHLLAGLAEFAQRNHPCHLDTIRRSYRWLLRSMIEPVLSAQPRKIDYAALPSEARPYLLGPYLGIHPNDRFAEVDLVASRPSDGRLVMLQTGGPVDADLWRGCIPRINAWLGGHWTLTEATATTVTLVNRPPLPRTIPFARSHLATGALFAGIDVISRKPLHIPFSDLTAGIYIPGAAGSGKTSALHILMRSIFANLDLFSAVHLVDGKDGVAMTRYSDLHPKVRVLYDEPDVWQLAADLNGLMKERNAEQRARGVDKAIRDFVAVVIDELPTFVAKPSDDTKKQHAQFLDNLQRIAMRGRSAGIRMFLITQQPVAEQIPVTLRSNCATVISFRLPETTHATALFGTLDATNDPRKLTTGQAIVLQGETGKLTTVQFPFAPLYQPQRGPA